MHALNASDRSRPLTLDRAPWNSTTLPLPPSLSPRNLQAFSPYALLSARTTMYTLPWSGRVSTVTTGIFCCSRRCSVVAIAPVSCGAITMALAPWLVNVCTLATRFSILFCEFVGCIMLTPRSLANCGTYLMYEFQKSVSARGKSTPTGADAPAAPLDPPVPDGLLELHAVAASTTRAAAATVRVLLRTGTTGPP